MCRSAAGARTKKTTPTLSIASATVDNIPPILFAVLILTLAPTAAYLTWIKPNYERDRDRT